MACVDQDGPETVKDRIVAKFSSPVAWLGSNFWSVVFVSSDGSPLENRLKYVETYVISTCPLDPIGFSGPKYRRPTTWIGTKRQEMCRVGQGSFKR